MSKRHYVPSTVRLPPELDQQIKDRAQISRRSRNDQIIYMLEKQIDDSVKSDLSLMSGQTGDA